tara:strand:+ start:764 stop:1282 length:519 start_codon:yes stop_codon:yes gene_type:complete
MSELRTNRIVPRDGLPSGASGGIIQCVQTVLTDGFTYTNTSFADIPSPGLSVSITPTSSSNKILVIADISCGGTDGHYNIFQLVRGSTNIYKGTDSKTYIGSKIWYTSAGNASDGSSMGGVYMSFLDSPATTSAVTYKVQVRVTGSTAGINRRASYDDTSLASTLTVMEVSG